MSQGVYLDWNATTPLHPAVSAAMRRAEAEAWANPASVHAPGRKARAVVEELREKLAALLEAHPRDVVLTSGGTESNNLALGAATAVVTSRLEHPSVTRSAERLAAQGKPVVWLDVPASGVIEPAAIESALSGLPAGATVALSLVNHETGVIQPVAETLAVTRRLGARLHVDAVQAVGKVDPGPWLHADSLSVAAHKIRGPKGIGALVWRGPPSGLGVVMVGGAQERGLRPGTQDPIAAAGFSAAIERARSGPASYRALAPLRDHLERALETAEVNAAGSPRVPHVSSLFVPSWRGDELVAALDLEGIYVASGAACSAGTAGPSPVLTAMLGAERAQGSIRVSLGESTTAEELERAIDAFHRVLARRRPTP